jgi:hypothetical protein
MLASLKGGNKAGRFTEVCMANGDLPLGKRFSQIYIERGEPKQDGPRFRKRLSAYFGQVLNSAHGIQIAKNIELDLGLKAVSIGGYNIYFDHSDFFMNAELKDLLDSITIIYEYVINRSPSQANNWLRFVQRVLTEENLGYAVDDKGVVHYFVDQEFEKNRLSVLSGLEGQRYKGVLEEFEDSHQKLISIPQDTKGSVRAIFEANEILFKLMLNAERLSSQNVRDKLIPTVKDIYKGDATASKSADNLLKAFCAWIDAAHMYRHGQKEEEPVKPPLTIAIELVSMGASYLRWLVEIDKELHKSNGLT